MSQDENYARLKKETEAEMQKNDTAEYDDTPVIAIYDVRGIQAYIFKTNKLKEIEGASKIVNNIFAQTLNEAICELNKEQSVNLEAYTDWENNAIYRFDAEKPDIEVIFSGAGNTTVLYKTGKLCRIINRKLSFLTIKKTYSLNLAIAVTKKTENYKDDYTKLKIKLAIIKAKMKYVSFQSSFPLTRKDINNDPESEFYKGKFVSREACRKLAVREEEAGENNSRGEQLLDNMKIEKNIAIVHIDGNGIGGAVRDKMQNLTTYKEAVETIRKTSKNINASFNKKPIEYVKKSIEKWNEDKTYFREVINAGDDITFVCAAEIAMSLCELYMDDLKGQENNFTACAGIAYIGSHFPFSRGYEIAEKCCDNAKKKMRKKNGAKASGYWIDFQIVKSMINDLKEYRDANYKRGEYNLLSRPYCLDEGNNAFEKLKEYIRHFKNADNVPRTWCKELRNSYDASETQASVTLSKMQSRGHKLPEKESILYDKTKKTALYFDALEIMDYFEDVKETKNKDKEDGSDEQISAENRIEI